MAAARFQSESRKPAGSPRPKGRDSKDTLCRNVLIYGHCRYEDQGCAFMHDPQKVSASSEQKKNNLSFDSPVFTPATISILAKPSSSSFTTQAAAAATFTPRSVASGTVTPNPQQHEIDYEPQIAVPLFNPAASTEFVPGASEYGLTDASANGMSHDHQSYSDPFSMASAAQALGETQYSAFQDPNALATNGVGYYPPQAAYNQAPSQPTANYHLYSPIGPHREDLLPYQKNVHDFFLPEKLREELQRKAAATLQVLPSSALPPSVGNYHTLLPLVEPNAPPKNASAFDYPGWVYRATSSKNGKTYCLRRLQGYRLTNENAIRRVQQWKEINHPNIVSTYEAFTTQEFNGESSLVFVTDFFPLSKTLTEQHSAPVHRFSKGGPVTIAEDVLWSYIVQIAAAIKQVHAANLAVRCMDPGKIIITDKNRVRLAACAVLDVVHFDRQRSIEDLQEQDLRDFGKLILGLGVGNPTANVQATSNTLDQFSRKYTSSLQNVLSWLLSPSSEPKTIDHLLPSLTPHLLTQLHSTSSALDTSTSLLTRELENARLVRLLTKLNMVTEHPSLEKEYARGGKYYLLGLFRDYVFHQVDADGRPVVDLAHVLRCMARLDVGSEEKVRLTGRSGEEVWVVSYREVRAAVGGAWGELQRGGAGGGRY